MVSLSAAERIRSVQPYVHLSEAIILTQQHRAKPYAPQGFIAPNFALTYDTVQLNGSIGENKWQPCGRHLFGSIINLAYLSP